MNSRHSRVFPPMFVLVAAFAVGACNSPAAPTVNVPYSQTDLVPGTGAEAVVGATLSVLYNGWLYDPDAPEQKGQVFDSAGPLSPFVFVLGTTDLIEGWNRGIPGMRVGGRRRLVIPPDLGYGSTGFGPIPPNATLLFEIDLFEVQ